MKNEITMRFEEHDGMIFRMLDKPDPLQLDSPTPRLVRYIQDCSPMGRYMKRKYAMVINTVAIVRRIGTDGRAYSSDEIFAEEVEVLEIIGYPVEEGSKEWAWYQMEQNHKVFLHNDSMPDGYWSMTSDNEKKYAKNSRMGWELDYEEFTLNLSYNVTGWQIYKEPKPKPLLADAKVGDLCKHRNGDWSQIIDTNGTYIQGQPIRTTLRDTKGINRNFCLSGSHFTMQFGGEYDIIHTEPLAPEGSAEWAVQRMKLGDKVTKRHLISHVYWHYDARPHLKCISEYNCGTLQIMVVPEIWLKTADPTGWQIYEPEPEFKVGDWVTDGVVVGHVAVINDGNAWVKTKDAQYHLSVEHLRKLSPSEVIVKIGCLSGTVRCCDNKNICPESTPDNPCHFVLQDQITGFWSIIYFKMLDAPTRELVESLLAIQQKLEGKNELA